jgi:hypothetical protein
LTEDSKIEIKLTDLQGFIIYIYVATNNDLNATHLVNGGKYIEVGEKVELDAR